MPISDTSIFASIRISCKLIELVASAVPYIILGDMIDGERRELFASRQTKAQKKNQQVRVGEPPTSERDWSVVRPWRTPRVIIHRVEIYPSTYHSLSCSFVLNKGREKTFPSFVPSTRRRSTGEKVGSSRSEARLIDLLQ